jgi:ATP-dependent 26S proteasome regulatory subunit
MSSSDEQDLVRDLREAASRGIDQLSARLENVEHGGRLSNTQLRELVKRQEAILERVMESSAFIGEIVRIRGDQQDNNSDIIVSCYGRILSLKPLPGVRLCAGDMVKLAPNSSQIISVIDRLNVGSVCTVRRVIDPALSEVDLNGSARVVLNGNFAEKIQAGDRVILDSSGSLIAGWFGKPVREKFHAKPEARWDDIVGLEIIKRQLRDAIILPFKNDKQFKHYNRKPFKGAFIFGPPGCGKTMLGEATANELADLYGAEQMGSGYFYVRGPEFLDMFVGNTEKGIRQLDDQANEHFEKYHFPAIIFLDEVESIASRRGSGKSSDMEKTVVPTLLGVMNKSTAIYLLATNRPEVIDPAVIRDGRITRHFHVTRPNRDNALVIIEKGLSKYPLYPEGSSAHEFAKNATDEFYSDKYILNDEEIPLKNKQKIFFSMGHIANGAMFAGIVEAAANIAESRDRDSSGLTGITQEDLKAAVNNNFEEKKGLNHQDELREFIRSIKDQIEPDMLRQVSAP